jgi:hypothetical protein
MAEKGKAPSVRTAQGFKKLTFNVRDINTLAHSCQTQNLKLRCSRCLSLSEPELTGLTRRMRPFRLCEPCFKTVSKLSESGVAQ